MNNYEILFAKKMSGGGSGGNVDGANVTPLTGYEEAAEAEPIEATDSLLEALGKLEKGVSDNETNISSLNTTTTSLQAQIDNIVTPVTQDVDYTYASTYEHTYDGYFSEGGFNPNGNFRSVSYKCNKDTYIYVKGKNDTYFSICIYKNDTLTNGVRYRFVAGGEDTLPYESNKLRVYDGDYIVYSVNASSTYFDVCMENYLDVGEKLDGDINLDENQINQVKNSIGIHNIFFKYSNTASGTTTESVDIYMPSVIGYVKYHFIHGVSQNANYNIWRVEGAYAASDNFVDRFALTTSGEWEMAVKLSGNPDFSGGTTHGDEIMSSIVFFIDGEIVDITDYTDITECSEIEIVQTSDVYDSSDSVTKIATHTSSHVFNASEMNIKQTLLWDLSSSTQLSAAYLAMHLPAKTITNAFYTDQSYTPTLCAGNYGYIPKAKYASVYGDTGVKSEFWITDYPTGISGGDRLLLTDNGGGDYNKCYFVIADNTAWLGSGETLWTSSAHYKFTVSK